MSPLLSRVLVVVVLLPLVIGLVYLGGWWLFALALVGGLLALHELYVMARELRPLVLGGYLGFAATLLGLQLGGLEWMLGGLLVTFVFAFVVYGLGGVRQSATSSFGGDAPRGRLGGSGARLPPPHPRHPRLRLLGRHGGAVHGLRGRHGSVLRRADVRTAPPGTGDLAREVVGGLRRRSGRRDRDGLRDPLQGSRRLPLDPASRCCSAS